jgi:hypothetical protein
MTGKQPKGKSRKVVLPIDSVAPGVTLGVGFQERWPRIKMAIPGDLLPEKETALREGIFKSCATFMGASRLRAAGAATAAAIRKPGAKQLAPLASFARHLLAASATWSAIKGLQDDRLGPLSDQLGSHSEFGGYLESLAKDAERRLKILRSIKPTKPAPARDLLVWEFAEHCRAAGLDPISHGRMYEQGALPTWFQGFVAAINDQILGVQGWGPVEADKRALYSDVAKAMRGYGK